MLNVRLMFLFGLLLLCVSCKEVADNNPLDEPKEENPVDSEDPNAPPRH